MIELFLKPGVFEALFVAASILITISGFVLKRKGWVSHRHSVILKLVGPAFIVIYGLMILLQTLLGFSSVWAVLIVLLLSSGIGIVAGLYVQNEPQPAKDSKQFQNLNE